MRHASFFAILTVLVALPVSAQQSAQSASGQPDYAALLQKIRDLEDRVISLEGQVLILKSQQLPPAQPPPATPPAKAGAQPPTPQPQGQEESRGFLPLTLPAEHLSTR